MRLELIKNTRVAESEHIMSRQLAGSKSSILILLIAFVFIFASNVYANASEKSSKVPSFGKGKVLVRLYTDYFCGPCSRMEPKVEQTLLELVNKNLITLTLIDTPVHAGTPLYAKYFLFILNVKRDVDHALKSRAVLFEAASNKVENQEKLEEFLWNKNIKFKQSDPSATLATLSSSINEDSIKSTPTCVIIINGKKAVYTGETDITTALQALKLN